MKVLVAVDRYEDILSSHEAGTFIKEGIISEKPSADVITVPLFDGDRDMVKGVLSWQAGKKYRWMIPDGDLEMKEIEVAGIDEKLYIDCAMLYRNTRDLTTSSSEGLGKIILNGLDLGYRDFVISFGEAKVFDGGIGLLGVLGATFFDIDDKMIAGPLNTSDIKHIRSIKMNLDDRFLKSKITVISDHDYYLYGSNSQIAQMDLTNEEKKMLDNNIWYFNEQMKKVGYDLTAIPHGGNGGGLCALLCTFGAVKMTSKEMIYQETSIEKLLELADIVVFGGGTLDVSTGSLVSQAILEKSQSEKKFIYLTAGRQLPITDPNVMHMNVYPEITNQTESIQIGVQLTNTIRTLMKMI